MVDISHKCRGLARDFNDLVAKTFENKPFNRFLVLMKTKSDLNDLLDTKLIFLM